ncbi:PAS domain S-box protein [Spizellomyces punctatus DAOM BR117]|uniref:histidine kinase n=1 Tax=Spizellomyces punctatus (strain DAOM BR117) TaxID=645134 RepID=A0A0L0H5Q8_SPIPD|nr:PAS domain S-box protein [Spizellomyces punctatus DAOM BR117]KNC96547.1 PAS domain S-box protein [Spizellomyces punctatus DAOM BR117]|eukprot:XP_016604587.1 PAS domain S-box protein [Spizellomyces punctatus DAOM BR117]
MTPFPSLTTYLSTLRTPHLILSPTHEILYANQALKSLGTFQDSFFDGFVDREGVREWFWSGMGRRGLWVWGVGEVVFEGVDVEGVVVVRGWVKDENKICDERKGRDGQDVMGVVDNIEAMRLEEQVDNQESNLPLRNHQQEPIVETSPHRIQSTVTQTHHPTSPPPTPEAHKSQPIFPTLRLLNPSQSKTSHLLYTKDWSKTPLGPMSSWPNSFLTVLSVVLSSSFPMSIWWGKEMTLIYNDGYVPITGNKHPHGFGISGREFWAELWDDIVQPIVGKVWNGETHFVTEQRLFVERFGFKEEGYFTWSFIPIRQENGSIGGWLNPAFETTDRCLASRRLRTLRELSTHLASTRTTTTVYETAATIISSNPYDLPFALFYQSSNNGFELASTAGIPLPHIAAPKIIQPGIDCPWPFEEALQKSEMMVIEIGEIRETLPRRGWGDIPKTAVVAPVWSGGRCEGVVVLGVSARSRFCGEYRTFVELLVRHLGASLTSARSHEEQVTRAKKLAELDHAKTTFFQSISHELRTPLTLILGTSAQALSNPLPDPLKSHLVAITKNGTRLLKMVNSLLDVSKVEAGGMQGVFRETDLGCLTRDLASVFRAAVEKAGLEFCVECDEVGGVWVDAELWEKIVFNLVSNAYKYTLQGKIHITLTRTDTQIYFSVTDTGLGIPADHLPKLFDRFHTIQNHKGRGGEGTGIGLALANELVKLHGGSIRVSSVLGEGSTFQVVIPVGREHLPSQIESEKRQDGPSSFARTFVQDLETWNDEESSPPSLPDNTTTTTTNRPRILLVDDNADIRSYITSLLIHQNWRVTHAKDGTQALQLALSDPPDLVLSDVMMPGLDGFELIKALKSRNETRCLPVILVSARAGAEALYEGLNAGADDYLVKPFSAKELVARITTHLELGHLRKSLQNRIDIQTKSLAESQARYKTLANLAPVGIFRTTVDGTVTYTNDKWWEITGHDKTLDPDCRHHLMSIHPDDKDQVIASWNKSLAKGTPFKMEFRWAKNYPDGTERWCLAQWTIEKNGTDVLGAVGSITDLSITKKLEREKYQVMQLVERQLRKRAEDAEHVKKQQERFIDMACHEWRNPLNGIYNSADLIQASLERIRERLEEDSSRHSHHDTDENENDEKDTWLKTELANNLEATKTITLCARHQKKIADDVLNVSKLGFDLLVLTNTRFDPHMELVNEMKTKNIQWEIHIKNTLENVTGDPMRISQVLMNLISNALVSLETAHTKHITVTIDTSNLDNTLYLIYKLVETTPTRNHLTLPTTHKTYTDYNSPNLSLFVSKRIVELMGGTMTVLSNPSNTEWTFTVLVRQCTPSTTTTTTKPPRLDTSKNVYKILIVEDNLVNQKVLKRHLDRQGHTSHIANNGQEALDMLRQTTYDIILMDLEMPILDGLGAAERIRAWEKEGVLVGRVPIVAVTGNARGAYLERAMQVGMDEWVVKPYDKEELFEKIQVLCAGKT